MLHLYHSPAVFAARGRALTVLALMQDGEELSPSWSCLPMSVKAFLLFGCCRRTAS